MRALIATVKTALRALRRNKLRSGLTALGIIIGVGTIIAMIGIGNGARAQVEAQVASLGENVIQVSAGSVSRTSVRLGLGSSTSLTVDDAEAIENEVPDVIAVSPEVKVTAQVVAEELFGDEDPIGEIMRIKNVPFKVIGVLTAKGTSAAGYDQDDNIIIPFTSAMKRVIGQQTNLRRINIQAASAEALADVQNRIIDMLRHRHRIDSGKDDDFSVRSQLEIHELATATARTMTLLLGAIASVSLVVGGIGIMNIMLVSVTERTREIGIRMAVGARGHDILRQFLVEAFTLSSLGGAIGIAAGVGASELFASLGQWPTVVSPSSVVIAFLFSAAVGVFFGFYPARKASRLDPIVALRYE